VTCGSPVLTVERAEFDGFAAELAGPGHPRRDVTAIAALDPIATGMPPGDCVGARHRDRHVIVVTFRAGVI
jgi:hypothetical protein